MVNPPIVVCIKPTIFEMVLLAFITAHLFRRRIIPAMKSATPMARNINVNRDAVAWSAKTLTSIMFDKMRKTAPVKIRLVTIRKPPMAMLSLTSFRIQFTSVGRKSALKLIIIVENQFNIFASFRMLRWLESGSVGSNGIEER